MGYQNAVDHSEIHRLFGADDIMGPHFVNTRNHKSSEEENLDQNKIKGFFLDEREKGLADPSPKEKTRKSHNNDKGRENSPAAERNIAEEPAQITHEQQT